MKRVDRARYQQSDRPVSDVLLMPPQSLKEAGEDLFRLATICDRAGLDRAALRLRVLAEWLPHASISSETP